MSTTVLKFGGTSVGTADRMKDVFNIVKNQPGTKIVVLSAMSGTTNALVKLSELIKSNDQSGAIEALTSFKKHYAEVITRFDFSKETSKKILEGLKEIFELLCNLIYLPYTVDNERITLAQGELISTKLFFELCLEQGTSSSLISALDFMRIDDQKEPAQLLIKDQLLSLESQYKGSEIIITQGYICKNHLGEIDNLQRGGSDYSATIIGAILNAEEVQIWTDIDGFHNNDPRIVEDTQPIRKLSYREAAELAYFGAKILHPTCVLPAEKAGIPIRLKYTMEPSAPGTLISVETSDRAITALAAKEGITAIKIYSHRMLMAYGFLRKVFQVFEDHETPVDMITTSEVAVSLTIDDTKYLKDIERNLLNLGEVQIQHNHAIICIVGNALYENKACLKAIFDALGDIPIRMVSMGGSNYNISILLEANFKEEALKRLNSLFTANIPALV